MNARMDNALKYITKTRCQPVLGIHSKYPVSLTAGQWSKVSEEQERTTDLHGQIQLKRAGKHSVCGVITVKILNWDARNLCCNPPKIQTKRLNLREFYQNGANGIVNSEDPDQTAPLQEQSDLGMHCLLRSICPKT